MQRIATRLLGLALVVAVGLFAYTDFSGPATPETGGLTPLAPQGIEEPDSADQVPFIDDEPVTPFVDDADEAPIDGGIEAGSGMAVPGFEGDITETVVEVDSGMPMVVPGFEGDVTDMVVEVD